MSLNSISGSQSASSPAVSWALLRSKKARMTSAGWPMVSSSVVGVAAEARQDQADQESDQSRDQQRDDQRSLRLADHEVDRHLLEVDRDEHEADGDQDDREPEARSATFSTGPLHPARP